MTVVVHNSPVGCAQNGMGILNAIPHVYRPLYVEHRIIVIVTTRAWVQTGKDGTNAAAVPPISLSRL